MLYPTSMRDGMGGYPVLCLQKRTTDFLYYYYTTSPAHLQVLYFPAHRVKIEAEAIK